MIWVRIIIPEPAKDRCCSIQKLHVETYTISKDIKISVVYLQIRGSLSVSRNDPRISFHIFTIQHYRHRSVIHQADFHISTEDTFFYRDPLADYIIPEGFI